MWTTPQRFVGALLILALACSPKTDAAKADASASAGGARSTGAPAPSEPASGSPMPSAGSAENDVDWQAYRRQTAAAPRDTIPSNAYNGWKQYELLCARCHGEFGVGTSFAPSLVESLKTGKVPDRQTFTVIVCQGRKEKGMPSWCEAGLEMDKIADIYAYLRLRADGKVAPGRPAREAEG